MDRCPPVTSRIRHANVREDELPRPGWLPHDRWPFTLRRYQHPRAGGPPTTIHYMDEGSGPVLVLVHAGMWSFLWRDTVLRLRTSFRCITLDFPGAGLSEGFVDDAALAEDATVLNGLLDHCGVDRATFVVHDLGGVVGVAAAAHHPERLQGLVAVNTFAWPPAGRALTTMLRTVSSRPTTAILGRSRFVLRLSASRMGVGRHYDSADRAVFLGPYRAPSDARGFHHVMRSATRSPALFRSAELSLRGDLANRPVLTVFGERNDPFGFAQTWRSLFPGADSWVVPGGNHFPMCDDPDGFAARLMHWHGAQVANDPT